MNTVLCCFFSCNNDNVKDFLAKKIDGRVNQVELAPDSLDELATLLGFSKDKDEKNLPSNWENIVKQYINEGKLRTDTDQPITLNEMHAFAGVFIGMEQFGRVGIGYFSTINVLRVLAKLTQNNSLDILLSNLITNGGEKLPAAKKWQIKETVIHLIYGKESHLYQKPTYTPPKFLDETQKTLFEKQIQKLEACKPATPLSKVEGQSSEPSSPVQPLLTQELLTQLLQQYQNNNNNNNTEQLNNKIQTLITQVTSFQEQEANRVKKLEREKQLLEDNFTKGEEKSKGLELELAACYEKIQYITKLIEDSKGGNINNEHLKEILAKIHVDLTGVQENLNTRVMDKDLRYEQYKQSYKLFSYSIKIDWDYCCKNIEKVISYLNNPPSSVSDIASELRNDVVFLIDKMKAIVEANTFEQQIIKINELKDKYHENIKALKNKVKKLADDAAKNTLTDFIVALKNIFLFIFTFGLVKRANSKEEKMRIINNIKPFLNEVYKNQKKYRHLLTCSGEATVGLQPEQEVSQTISVHS